MNSSRIFVGVAVAAFLVSSLSACDDDKPGSCTEAALGSDLPSTPMQVDEISHPTLAALADNSELIVTGEVSTVQSIRDASVETEHRNSEYFRISVAVERTLKGASESPSTVDFVWEGFTTRSDSKRQYRIIQNGVEMPDVGEHLLLFLSPEPPHLSEQDVAKASFRVNTLDGILCFDGDSLSTGLNGSNRVAHDLTRKTVDDLVKLLKSS